MQRYNHKRATAHIRGSDNAPYLSGKANFYQRHGFVWVIVDVSGLPENSSGFFAFHIHEGESCRGEGFPETGNHFNPGRKMHPMHAGDLPPLLSCNGKAYMTVMTDRFSIDEILGKTIIIHSGADDFTTQPSGNAGEKIACGVIQE